MSIQSDEEKRDALRTRLTAAEAALAESTPEALAARFNGAVAPFLERLTAAEAREAALVEAADMLCEAAADMVCPASDECSDEEAAALRVDRLNTARGEARAALTASRPHAEAHDERMREEGRAATRALWRDHEVDALRTALSERTAEVERLRAENESARVATLRMLHEWVDNNHVGRDDDDNDIAKDIRTEIGNMILEATMPPDAEP